MSQSESSVYLEMHSHSGARHEVTEVIVKLFGENVLGESLVGIKGLFLYTHTHTHDRI